MQDFGPYKVRLAIESLGHDPVTEKDTYSRLCEMGVHVSPASAYISHDVGRRLYVGGNYSAPGSLLVLNETAHRISPLFSIVGSLVGAPDNKAQIIEETARELAESASGLGVDNYEEFFDSQKTEHAREMALQALEQMGEAKFQPWSQGVVEDMTNRGELPADIADLTEEEFQDKVFTEMLERLSKQAMEKELEEEDLWLRQSAAAALVHDTLAKAARYRGDQTSPDENTEPGK